MGGEEEHGEQRDVAVRPETRKRGRRVLRQRTLVSTPRHTDAVSRRSVCPGAAGQEPWALPELARSVIPPWQARRASVRHEGGTVLVNEPCREVACLEPVERAATEDDRGRACGVGLDANLRQRSPSATGPSLGGRCGGRCGGVRRVLSASGAVVLEVTSPPAVGQRSVRLVGGRCGRRRCGSASRLRAAYPQQRYRLRVTRGRPSRCGRPPRRRCGRPRPPWPWRPVEPTPAGRQTARHCSRLDHA